MKTRIALLSISILVYVTVKYFVPYGVLLLYPLILLVTFFHEFGHALFALLTGGTVHGIQINPNGSGFAQISGGITPLVAMGGYVGSAILGNLLLYMGLANKRYARGVPWVLSAVLLFTAVIWFRQLFTSAILCVFAVGLIWLARKRSKWIAPVLAFLGSTSVLYIVEDFNHGPKSDLAVFSKQIPLLPPTGWAVIWLVIVLVITWGTLRRAFRERRSSES
ncbi:MAG: M50 family metallopeptidase [Deltaproteobacteria bacterium]|nr:M50 family metallopeptidase [Deltaproteobacteria bacterium]